MAPSVTAAAGRNLDPGWRDRSRTRRALVWGVVLSLLLGACSAPEDTKSRDSTGGTGHYDRLRPVHRDTGNHSELVAQVSVVPRATEASKRVVYSQKLELAEGQVLLVVAEIQVTNDLGYNVFVASQLVLAGEPDDVKGKEITAANGRNLTPDMHHEQQTKSGTYEVASADEGPRYLNLVVWSAGSQASSGDVIAVDQGYGKLSVLVW